MQTHEIRLTIKANRIQDNGNNTFDVYLPGRALDAVEHRVLESLFPNLQDKAFELLNQESLLAAMASDAEILAAPVKETKNSEKKQKGTPKKWDSDTCQYVDD